MRKLLTALCLLYATTNFAQITLEHTYPTDVWLTQIGSSDWNYYTQVGSALSIYDITHAIIKSITIPTVAGYIPVGVSLVSTNLFNTDSYYEYGVYYYNSSTYAYQFAIYNELGTQLLIVDSANTGSCFNTSSGLKMIVNQYSAHRSLYYAGNVYSLGGNYLPSAVSPVINGNGNGNEMELAYPNPSNNMIHLTYSLPNGTSQGQMFITNINGQVVKTCNVGSAFNDLLLDTKQYAPGEYVYYIQAGSYTSTPTKFIISR